MDHSQHVLFSWVWKKFFFLLLLRSSVTLWIMYTSPCLNGKLLRFPEYCWYKFRLPCSSLISYLWVLLYLFLQSLPFALVHGYSLSAWVTQWIPAISIPTFGHCSSSYVWHFLFCLSVCAHMLHRHSVIRLRRIKVTQSANPVVMLRKSQAR